MGEPDNNSDYNLIVLGAGSAGFSASITAADQGAKVAMIGHGTIGGTCVNVGCVPSKTLIRASEALHQSREASRFGGISAQATVDDWRQTAKLKDELVTSLREAKYSNLLPDYENVSYIEGKAKIVEGGVDVDGTLLKSDKIVIATGSSSAVPSIPGIEDIPYLNSTTALDLKTQPCCLLVIGGGYIGCELAQMFARAGTKVTIICRSKLLPEAESEISDALAKYFVDEGITVITGAQYKSIRITDEGKDTEGVALDILRNGTKETIETKYVLLTTGRSPNTAGLGLDMAGVDLSDNGGIIVDDRMRTSVEGIYAAGDVTGRDMFVYMAAYGARIAANNALNSNSHVYDASIMPAVVFTDPQAASVGLTEAAARAQGMDIRTSVLPLSAVPRALAARDTRGLIKLIAETETDRLIGAHILAPEGSDSIQTAVLAIKFGMTISDLAGTIFPYLTTVEGLKLAAQTFDKDVSKLSCCAG